jgi:hypothetical protein
MNGMKRVHLVVEAGSLAAVRTLAVAIGDGGAAEGSTASAPLSPTGAGPATHFGASVRLKAEQLAALAAVVQAGQLPAGAWYWRVEELPSEVLETTNHGPSAAAAGGAWSFAQSAAAVGLVPVATEVGG